MILCVIIVLILTHEHIFDIFRRVLDKYFLFQIGHYPILRSCLFSGLVGFNMCSIRFFYLSIKITVLSKHRLI